MDIEKTFDELSLHMLREFVAQRRQEDLYLDFKLVEDPDLRRDDRRCESGRNHREREGRAAECRPQDAQCPACATARAEFA